MEQFSHMGVHNARELQSKNVIKLEIHPPSLDLIFSTFVSINHWFSFTH